MQSRDEGEVHACITAPFRPLATAVLEEHAWHGSHPDSGVPVILNTSFNAKEPIVASPADGIRCCLRPGMDVDVLAIGNFFSVCP
jgi:Carbamoyltransferase C-terminus